MELFSEEGRRNPYPIYEKLRESRPALHDPRARVNAGVTCQVA